MERFLIGHIGVIVADLDAAVRTISRLFEIEPIAVKELEAVGLRVAEFQAENVTLELLQYTTDAAGLARDTMGGATGLNHLSITVDDMESAIHDFQAKGLKLMEGFPRPGSHGSVAFFHPESTTGLLLEVCRPDEGTDE
jgi:methylmalonyl-CoA/ethylmalonyl-CoA epimerase